jgi:hypothetical protein
VRRATGFAPNPRRYTRDVYAKNGAQGDLFWFRLALPL